MAQRWLWVADIDRCFDEAGELLPDIEPGAQKPGDWWSCDARTRPGDTALLYVTRPLKQIEAFVDVRSPAREPRPYEHAERRWPYVCDYRVSELLDGPTYRAIRADPELDAWREGCRNFKGSAFEVPPTIWGKPVYLARSGR